MLTPSRPVRRKIIASCTFLVLLSMLYLSSDLARTAPPRSYQASHRKEFVVASMKGDETAWLSEHLPDWKANIYVANDPSASLTVPRNKGRESMVYLTYIIDNYNNLPAFMVFMHSLRYQWHNDDPLYDGVPMLRKLRLEHVANQGYVNLRCAWALGCPAEIQPRRDHVTEPEQQQKQDDRTKSEAAYADAFTALFPGTPVPDAVGVGCCAQFAVTREKVLERPRESYEAYRRWLLETPLADAVSGRVMEYSWHVIFGMPAVSCPDPKWCYCQTYGLCNLNCTFKECEGRYTLPRYATIPAGWPEHSRGRDGWP